MGSGRPDIFLSYNREDQAVARRFAEAFEAEGFDVWWDTALKSGEAYDEVTEMALRTAKAVAVLWSPRSTASRWVRAEATLADRAKTLVPCMIEPCERPIMFELTQTAELSHWRGDPDDTAWRAYVADVRGLISRGGPAPLAQPLAPAKPSILILPFVNMSGDPEQEYFSDGVTEDIITDLGRVAALSVTSRNAAFALKGQVTPPAQLAREQGVSHILTGSVRKAGKRLRITAQLVHGRSDQQIWAERWDRDLDDIFALQDEIAEATIRALKLTLLPEEKKAIERRDTTSTEAYETYLRARRLYILSNMTEQRNARKVVDLCRRAIDVDPAYARAWALMAMAQRALAYAGYPGEDGLAAAEKALSLDPTLAAAHGARINSLIAADKYDEARAAIAAALRIDPESYEVNNEAGRLALREGRHHDAIGYYELLARLDEDNFSAPGLLMTCYAAVGDRERLLDAAKRTLARTEIILAREPDNGSVLSMGVGALATLGNTERARQWARRALIVDPDNLNMRYNIACSFVLDLKEFDTALDMLEPAIAGFNADRLAHVKMDSDLNTIRDHPRFKAMIAAAEARLAKRP